MTDVLDAKGLIGVYNALYEKIEEVKDELCRLDGEIGDGDHGVTMSIGFTAIRKALQQLDTNSTTLTEVFNTAAKSFLSAVGGSAGPLYSTAFMRAGALVKGKETMDVEDMRGAVVAMCQGIKDRGKAEAGEKTMLDAWLAAAEAAESADGSSFNAVLSAACKGARRGAEATKDMVATKGRASRLGERSLGHPDPGAVSTAIMLETMAAALA